MVGRLNLLFWFLVSLSGQAQVWTETQQWTPEWENRYSKWVESEWGVDFFSRSNLKNGQPNRYYGLRKDCADTVYSMRAIFSFENKLPFVMNDPTGGSKLITNKMTQFDRSQSSDEKIRRFLTYLDALVSTRSLPYDTYPTAVTKNSIRAGGLILATKVNHHSWTIKQILPIGVPWLVYNSTIGRNSGPELKQRQSWPNPYWVFQGNQTPDGYAGFRDWKPIELITKPQWQIPGYSDEQYRVPLKDWVKWAQKRLAVQTETPEKTIERLSQTVCEGLKLRVGAVQEALDYIRKRPSCLDRETYDIYSTPNRDQRIFDDLVALRKAYQDILETHKENSLNPITLRQMQKIFPFPHLILKDELIKTPSRPIDADSLCTINYAPQRNIDLAEAKRRISLGLFSNNPHDESEYRWGDTKGNSRLAARCPSWDLWSPDLNQN